MKSALLFLRGNTRISTAFLPPAIAVGVIALFITASLSGHEQKFGDSQWNRIHIEQDMSWPFGVWIDTNTVLYDGILEWDIETTPLGRWGLVEGYVGVNFQYTGLNAKNWIETRYAIEGYIHAGWNCKSLCTLWVDVYHGETLDSSFVVYNAKVDDDNSGYLDIAAKKMISFFPCSLVNNEWYDIRLRAKAYCKSNSTLFKAESEFQNGDKCIDLRSIKVWHDEHECYADWYGDDDGEYTVMGEYMIENTKGGASDYLTFSSYNKDAEIEEFEIYIQRMAGCSVERTSKRNIDVDTWTDGYTIPNGSSIYAKIIHRVNEKNTMGIKNVFWQPASAALRDFSAKAFPDHYWRFGYPEMVWNGYRHVFEIENEDPLDTLAISDLSFLVSPDSVAHISSLHFDGPLFDCTLAPGTRRSFEVLTNLPMIGGYIYFKYSIDDPASDDVVCNAWGGHEISPPGKAMAGDPGLSTGFPASPYTVTPDVPEIFTIAAANMAHVSSSCTGRDTFALHVYDSGGWLISGVPPIGQAHVLEPGESWSQQIIVTPPLVAFEGDTDTLIVVMVYCDSTGVPLPALGDCEDPNSDDGVLVYSSATLVLDFPIGTGDSQMPLSDFLSQNYPNPFNPVTTIAFGLAVPGRASLRVYDASGKLIRVLADESFPAGRHEVRWDGKNEFGKRVANGIYLYRLRTARFAETKKLVLIR